MISALFFGIAALIVLLTIVKKADFFAPARIFGFIWALAIALTELKLSGLQHSWSFESWLLVLLGPSSYLFGFFIAYVLNLRSNLLPLSEIRKISKSTQLKSNRLFIIVCLAFAFYSIGYLVIYFVKGFVPIFSPLLGSSRGEFTLFGLGLSVHTMPLIVFFSIIYLLTTAGEKVKKSILIFISLCSLITFFFLLQRFQLIMIGVMCIVLLYYNTRAIRLSTGLIIFSSLSLFFAWVSNLRSGSFFMLYLHTEAKMKTPREYAIFSEPYMYLVMNLENLARSVEKIQQHTYGYYTFNFVQSLLGLKYWAADYTNLDDTPFLISGFNTYTAFWVYYRDFGVFGLFLIPLVLGLLIGMLYCSLRKKPSLPKISAYTLLVFVMVISFFNNPFSYLWFMWTVFGMIIVYSLIRIRNKQVKI